MISFIFYKFIKKKTTKLYNLVQLDFIGYIFCHFEIVISHISRINNIEKCIQIIVLN